MSSCLVSCLPLSAAAPSCPLVSFQVEESKEHLEVAKSRAQEEGERSRGRIEAMENEAEMLQRSMAGRQEEIGQLERAVAGLKEEVREREAEKEALG